MVQDLALRWMFFGLIGLAVLLEVTADIFFKKWALGNRNVLLLAGLIFYFIGTVFWAFSLKYDLLSRAVSIFTILNLIVVVLVGVLVFNEHLSLMNKIGIGLGVLSVVLMEM